MTHFPNWQQVNMHCPKKNKVHFLRRDTSEVDSKGFARHVAGKPFYGYLNYQNQWFECDINGENKTPLIDLNHLCYVEMIEA